MLHDKQQKHAMIRTARTRKFRRRYRAAHELSDIKFKVRLFQLSKMQLVTGTRTKVLSMRRALGNIT